MLFGDVLAIALSIFGFLLSLTGLWLLCRAMWPERVEAAAGRCRDNGVACFFVGLPVMGVTLLVAGVMSKRGGTLGQLAGFSLGFLLLMYLSIGAAGLATHVGRRLVSPVDAKRPWKATIRGAVVLELAYLIPILGWLGLLPLSFIMGAGATTLSFFRSGRAASSSTGGGMVSDAAVRAGFRAPVPKLPELEEAVR